MVEYPHGTVRAATHYGVEASDIDTIVEATRAVLAEVGPARTAAPSLAGR